jgi:hypothetical protein
VVGPYPGGNIVEGDVAQVGQLLFAGVEHGGDRLFGHRVFDEFVVAADVKAVVAESRRHDEHCFDFGEVVIFVDRFRLFGCACWQEPARTASATMATITRRMPLPSFVSYCFTDISTDQSVIRVWFNGSRKL